MKKKGIDYFETFTQMMKASVRAARQLDELMTDYTDVSAKADRIHDTEHESDELFHTMMNELNRAFITPIDREDIITLAEKLDSITDAIEDTANLFDMLSVTEVRPAAAELSKLIIEGCDALLEFVEEFKSFKSSKKMAELDIKVNQVEEEGDRLHRRIIRDLYSSKDDVLEIIKWKEIYDMMELVLDLCEDVADLMLGLAVKNG